MIFYCSNLLFEMSSRLCKSTREQSYFVWVVSYTEVPVDQVIDKFPFLWGDKYTSGGGAKKRVAKRKARKPKELMKNSSATAVVVVAKSTSSIDPQTSIIIRVILRTRLPHSGRRRQHHQHHRCFISRPKCKQHTAGYAAGYCSSSLSAFELGG